MPQLLPTREIIETLVAFDTTSRGSNLALIDWIADYLDGFDIPVRLTFNRQRTKANLFATIGEAETPGIVLSGHSDVVPVDGQTWSSDPFRVREAEGKLFGRGVADMKSFLSAALSIAPGLSERRLPAPVHLAVSFDEEIGCLGVPKLLRDLEQADIRPRACIVGEPTEMTVVTGHKGKHSIRGHVRGLECHSALADRGVNAVEYAAEAISYLRAMMQRKRAEGPFDQSYDPAYSTVHTGVVAGGTALNIVPRQCSFDFEFRCLPGEDSYALLDEVKRFCDERLHPEMRRLDAAAGFAFEELAFAAALDTSEEAEVAAMVKSLTGANGAHRVAFGTEAGLFQQSGIPTVICGPGSIDQAHKPDEWIALDQIAQCERFLGRLIDHLAR